MIHRMNFPIGAVFYYNGGTYKVVSDINEEHCFSCAFFVNNICQSPSFQCNGFERSDVSNVHFESVMDIAFYRKEIIGFCNERLKFVNIFGDDSLFSKNISSNIKLSISIEIDRVVETIRYKQNNKVDEVITKNITFSIDGLWKYKLTNSLKIMILDLLDGILNIKDLYV